MKIFPYPCSSTIIILYSVLTDCIFHSSQLDGSHFQKRLGLEIENHCEKQLLSPSLYVSITCTNKETMVRQRSDPTLWPFLASHGEHAHTFTGILEVKNKKIARSHPNSEFWCYPTNQIAMPLIINNQLHAFQDFTTTNVNCRNIEPL